MKSITGMEHRMANMSHTTLGLTGGVRIAIGVSG